jgi:hypothetical protein
MSKNQIHKYFDRKYSDWNIIGFLDECDLEPFDRKIDEYLKSLQKIKEEEGMRKGKASQLLDRYRKACKDFFSIGENSGVTLASSVPCHSRLFAEPQTSVRAQIASLVICCSRLLADLTLDPLGSGEPPWSPDAQMG